MKKILNKKFNFTFFEIIAVITVLAIVSSIVFISVDKKENTDYAWTSSIASEINTMQTAVDKYFYDNNSSLPTISPVTESTPSQLDFKKLHPKYLKNTPEDKEFNYWVDFMGKIWISSVKTPSNVEIDKATGQVTWSEVSDAKSYNVFMLSGVSNTGAISNSKTLRKVTTTTQLSYKGIPNTTYLVSAVDKYGFSTAPAGSSYNTQKNPTKFKYNVKPTAVITMSPNKNITTTTNISWDYSASTDQNNDKIIMAEWRGKQDIYPIEGTYTVELRVQDEHGEWSDWVKTTFVVVLPNDPPTAVITMTPETNIDTETLISWDYTSSTDPNGDAIINAEWIGKQSTYTTEGTYTVELRVQDSKGLWGQWVSKTITVVKANHKPSAVITMNPETDLTTASNINFDYINSTDPDGDLITVAEWKNKLTTYPEGTHTVKLRVQDKRGLWSDWVSKTFTIGHYNEKPIAKITMIPDVSTTTVDTETNISWDYSLSSDPNGDEIISAEWKGTQNIYTTEGNYTVELRVQDEHGVWSDWTSKTFIVIKANQKPTAVITMTPEINIDTATVISWSSSSSSDVDGDTIINEEWIGKQSTYSVEGTYTVQLRVQDEHGLWSNWTTKTITVEKLNNIPVAEMVMTPDFELTSSTTINWSTVGSYDVDGDTIVNEEWIGKLSTYPEGTHTVKVRVQDSRGAWSLWLERTFIVRNNNLKPTAVIGMSPVNPTTESIITWDSNASTDPEGDTIINEEWLNKKNQYTIPGEYTTQLRVQDSFGLWSDFVGKTFLVTAPADPTNRVPTAVISAEVEGVNTGFPNTVTTIDTIAYLTWNYSKSTDPDGDRIIKAQWIGSEKNYPSAGTYTVMLRVMDEHGIWSAWVSKTFTVITPSNRDSKRNDSNQKPIAVITMNPDPTPPTETTLKFDGSTNYVEVGNLNNVGQGTNPITMKTRIFFNNTNNQAIFSKNRTDSPTTMEQNSLLFGVYYGHYNISWHIETAEVDTGVVPTIGKWIDLTFIVDGTNAIIYEDGVEVWSGTIGERKNYDNSTFRIGMETDFFGGAGDYLNGEIDHMQIFDRALSKQEILSSSSTDYIAEWNFNSITGNTLTETTNNWNGTIFGTVNKNQGRKYFDLEQTLFTFSSSNSYDPDGDKIIAEEWVNALPKYDIGWQTVYLRVQDNHGLWSDWTEKTFYIGNRKPVAIIDMTPDIFITAQDNVTWSDARSYDPDGNPIVQKVWEGKMVNYPDSHSYEVKLKVRDSYGLWSDWACKKVMVGDGGPQSDKYMDCDGTSNGTGTLPQLP